MVISIRGVKDLPCKQGGMTNGSRYICLKFPAYCEIIKFVFSWSKSYRISRLGSQLKLDIIGNISISGSQIVYDLLVAFLHCFYHLEFCPGPVEGSTALI